MALSLRLSKKSADGVAYPGDEAFLSGIKQAELVEATPQAVWSIYLMLTVVIVAITWAFMARVEQITKAEGKVVSDGREQVIASLEGGILRNMLVREGMTVEKGQDLLQIDPTRAEASQNEGEAKRLALTGTLARLLAESTGKPLLFPKEVRALPQIVHDETESYEARRLALEEAVGVTRRSLALLRRELAMAERMSAKGLMSEVEVMRSQRQVNDLTLQIQERVNRFRQDASGELVKVRSELAQLEEQMVVKQDLLTRTTLKSPVKGLVKNIRIATVGGVVPAGAAIMEILPLGSRVMIEARIKPADIGFVHVGLPVTVKLSAYDYFMYGGLKGTIDYISPDALGDDAKTGARDATYYRATIRSDVSTLHQGKKPLAVMPGMNATVEVMTGERTVLQYLLQPLVKSQEAFTER
ncbi:MAG: HlyD family type I secretion periplasmic adaptor subunit [Aquabacterium sp.]|uniref:HlyD family type I secretion periplasmic adaptor subunit n=1 Tax=Aquabacterium sp. TaxID=1872578 RepID=UPI00120A8CB4|nr:HlyD family type I secretion periplasmic adaptor subunit [Aquabacterium sp.]TAK95632.1 MAG: HlyD family type I secretion periplasmic adaptor subunit [Aquabacterium sp.]